MNRKSVIVTTSHPARRNRPSSFVAGVIFSHRSDAASHRLRRGDAGLHRRPVAVAGQPPAPRRHVVRHPSPIAPHAANKLFTNVADTYGMTKDGKNARYFAGLTAMEAGQTQTAESTFKQVAGGWNSDLAALAKLALADLYRQTGRDPQAIDLYNQLASKPTSTVPAATAQISLAELYTAEGKVEQARKIYAQLKDKDKDAKGQPGVAATIATQKLNPTPAPGAPPQP